MKNEKGEVQTEIVDIIYSDGITRKVRRPLLEIFEPKNAKEVADGTVKRGSATCPVTGFTTPVASVRKQLKTRKGGANDARLFCVVSTKTTEKGRFYRLPNSVDFDALAKVKSQLEIIEKDNIKNISLIPHENCPPEGALGFRFQKYGIIYWRDLYTPRQLVTLTTFVKLLNDNEKLKIFLNSQHLDREIQLVILSCLAIALGRVNDLSATLCRWLSSLEAIAATNGGQNKMPMILDFAEANPLGGAGGDWDKQIDWIVRVIENLVNSNLSCGTAQRVEAQSTILPEGSAAAIITDPPYYDAFGYSDLSEFFYIWFRRTVPSSIFLYSSDNVPKAEEAISIGKLLNDGRGEKNNITYQSEMSKFLQVSRTSINSSGIGVVVFANKTTTGWESILQAIIDSRWTITGSWPIDTERPNRQRAMNSAALASSIHLVCRPRTTKEIGDWRDIQQQLPQRIHAWLPRLASEGVVGADAIFACLGPALEIYSRYDSVEKASGEIVTLREYLEQIWAVVSQEALSMIFSNADATGLEEDARLTAIWLWTLSTGEGEKERREEGETGRLGEGEFDEEIEDEEEDSKTKKISGFTLEYDAARKIAQGLGVHLEQLSTLVEIKGDKARLLPVTDRALALMGKVKLDITPNKKKTKDIPLLPGMESHIPEDKTPTAELELANLGKTILDRIHQTMLLFAAGRSEAIKRFLVDEGVGTDERFWKLANALSALYPPNTDEKRWIGGVLARKKGLGF